jgi:hypothetical protein
MWPLDNPVLVLANPIYESSLKRQKPAIEGLLLVDKSLLLIGTFMKIFCDHRVVCQYFCLIPIYLQGYFHELLLLFQKESKLLSD